MSCNCKKLFYFAGNEVAFLLDGFLLPVDRKGFLGLLRIGRVKQEDIDLLAQVTVCSFLSIQDQIRDSEQRSYYEIKQHIDLTLHVLSKRAFEAFKIPVCFLYTISKVLICNQFCMRFFDPLISLMMLFFLDWNCNCKIH